MTLAGGSAAVSSTFSTALMSMDDWASSKWIQASSGQAAGPSRTRVRLPSLRRPASDSGGQLLRERLRSGQGSKIFINQFWWAVKGDSDPPTTTHACSSCTAPMGAMPHGGATLPPSMVGGVAMTPPIIPGAPTAFGNLAAAPLPCISPNAYQSFNGCSQLAPHAAPAVFYQQQPSQQLAQPQLAAQQQLSFGACSPLQLSQSPARSLTLSSPAEWPGWATFASSASPATPAAPPAAPASSESAPAPATPAPGAEAAFASFPVFTKTLTGATHVVCVAPYDNVHDVCSTVADRLEGARNVRLVYGGKQLKEGDRVYAYGIARDSTIHVVLRVGRERQRLAPLLAAPRVTIDVALASHACRSTGETDGRADGQAAVFEEYGLVVPRTEVRPGFVERA